MSELMGRFLAPKYWFGDMVYLKHDPEQLPRVVVDINFQGDPGHVSYGLACGPDRSLHYQSELSSEVDQIKAMGAFKGDDKY